MTDSGPGARLLAYVRENADQLAAAETALWVTTAAGPRVLCVPTDNQADVAAAAGLSLDESDAALRQLQESGHLFTSRGHGRRYKRARGYAYAYRPDVEAAPPPAPIGPPRAAQAAAPPRETHQTGPAVSQVPASWLDSLGPVVTGPHLCDSEDYDCDASVCGRPPMRYTGDHTAIVCPKCGPSCWTISPGAAGRARDYDTAQDQAARRERKASVRVPQAMLDAQGREVQRWRDQLLARVLHILDDPRITVDTRSDYTWFRDRLTGPAAAPLSLDRLAELSGEMDDCPVRRGWWRRALDAVDYDDLDEEGGDIVDAELVDEPEHPQLAPPASRPALEAAPPPGCQRCSLPAVARISTSVPRMIPEQDVCRRCFDDYAGVIDHQTFGNLHVLRQYGNAAGVRSIIRAPNLN